MMMLTRSGITQLVGPARDLIIDVSDPGAPARHIVVQHVMDRRQMVIFELRQRDMAPVTGNPYRLTTWGEELALLVDEYITVIDHRPAFWYRSRFAQTQDKRMYRRF